MVAEADNALMQPPPAAPNAAGPSPAMPTNQPTGATQPLGGDTGAPVGVDGAPLTVESMVDRLNVIRGGKSFSDPEVFGRLTTLWKGLPNETKTNIDKVLTEIGKVVINSPDAVQAEQPETTQQPQAPQTQQPAMNQQQPQQSQAPAPPAMAGAM